MDNLNSNNKFDKILDWLNDRGIPNSIIGKYEISYSQTHDRIIIPVFDIEEKFLFNKYRRNPEQKTGPKYTYDKGSKTALYCAHHLKLSDRIIICEGELDCLILQNYGFYAVTSTGGSQSFQEEWVPLFEGKEIFVCFDYDKAGEEGKIRISKYLPHAKNVPLPKEVGEHGDITDFFIKLKKTASDFETMLSFAAPLIPEEQRQAPVKAKKPRKSKGSDTDIAVAKAVPLEDICPVMKFDAHGNAICPFHNERTASFRKFPDNHFHCFGCGAHGDAIDFYMRLNNVGMKDAIRALVDQK